MWSCPPRLLAHVVVLLAAVAACNEGPTSGGTPALVVLAGDEQRGTIGRQLPVPLTVRATDGEGDPIIGREVTWMATRNGAVTPSVSTTDHDGRATSRFVMGTTPGPAEATATLEGVGTVTFTLEATEIDPPPVFPLGVLIPQAFQTYDGSGEVVHPDHAVTPWFHPEQLAITPYPNGNAIRENPSLFSSHWGVEWLLAPGVPNPVVPAPTLGHLSDPDIVYVPDTGELRMYYRQAYTTNRIYLVRSTDGQSWTPPQLVVETPNHFILSPSVVYRGPGHWWMWSINSGTIGCGGPSAKLEVRRSVDGFVWSAPQELALAHDGMFPWHVEVQWIPSRNEYWALYNAKTPGSCTTPALFLARSSDGIAWVPERRPVLVKGAIQAFQDIIYRGTFRFDPATNEVWLWHSGARFAEGRWTWSAALERRRVGDLIGLQAVEGQLRFAPPPVELTDWP